MNPSEQPFLNLIEQGIYFLIWGEFINMSNLTDLTKDSVISLILWVLNTIYMLMNLFFFSSPDVSLENQIHVSNCLYKFYISQSF